MSKEIFYKPSYITPGLAQEIRDYYEKINDSLLASNGPRDIALTQLGWYGCWDRQLHYEMDDSPIHPVVAMLKRDFGEFEIYSSSIRYLSAPFPPHSDIRDTEWLRELRRTGMKEGFVFLIPLWWDTTAEPGTAFFNSPANLDEPLYADMLDVLPEYAPGHEHIQKQFSVREVLKWNAPGDLIAWKNFQWHCSCDFGKPNYRRDGWIKEFVSIETAIKAQ